MPGSNLTGLYDGEARDVDWLIGVVGLDIGMEVGIFGLEDKSESDDENCNFVVIGFCEVHLIFDTESSSRYILLYNASCSSSCCLKTVFVACLIFEIHFFNFE